MTFPLIAKANFIVDAQGNEVARLLETAPGGPGDAEARARDLAHLANLGRKVIAEACHSHPPSLIVTLAQEDVRLPGNGSEPEFSLRSHLERQREWSAKTFGPGDRSSGVIDHIRKELREIEMEPSDLEEWIDVVILALDGAWRAGFSAEQIITQLVAKQAKNEARQWPDWRTMPTDKAIEHVK